MARITKKLFETFKDRAAQAVISEQTGERIQTKGGVFSKADIEAIEDDRTRKLVLERYTDYVDEAKAFNEARKRMSEAKWKLQNSLDRSFIRLGYVTRSFYWTILGLDEIESIVYRDSDKNYRERYLRSVKEKGKGSVKERGTEWGKAWDMAEEDIAELDAGNVRDTPQDIPPEVDENDLPANLADNPQAYIASFVAKKTPAAKIKMYRDGMVFSPDERVIFFGALDKQYQDILWPRMNEAEKALVQHVRKS